jgi:hypothetical protein
MNTIRTFIDAATAGMSPAKIVLATLIVMVAVALASSLLGSVIRPVDRRWSVARNGMRFSLVRNPIWVGCMAELPDGNGGRVASIYRRPAAPDLILLEDCFLADGDTDGPPAVVVLASHCTRIERQTFRDAIREMRGGRRSARLQDGGKP